MAVLKKAELDRPLFRVVAIDKRFHREGMSTEIVGAYDPLKKDKNLELDATKVEDQDLAAILPLFPFLRSLRVLRPRSALSSGSVAARAAHAMP